MSKVTVIAIEPCDQHRPGDRFDVSEPVAAELVAKGLVKMRAPHSNKMLALRENKRNPSKVAGETQPSSASQAAPVSPQTTAQPSEHGAQNRHQRRHGGSS